MAEMRKVKSKAAQEPMDKYIHSPVLIIGLVAVAAAAALTRLAPVHTAAVLAAVAIMLALQVRLILVAVAVVAEPK
jgi:hypothetical protein